MDIILDTAAILSGRFTSIPSDNNRYITTSLVESEIRHGKPEFILTNLKTTGLLIRDPENFTDARKTASITGDLEKLSKTDLSIISLAIELKEVLVLTDDFRIQNVLSKLDIRFQSAGEIGEKKIRETWTWTFRCRGCGKYFEKEPGPDCPICGSSIKKTRSK